MALEIHSSARRNVQPVGRLIVEAFDNLYAVRQRSFLALIGIVIGTASVIAMINIAHSAAQESARQFKEMGTDVLVARNLSQNEGTISSLLLADVMDLPATLPIVSAASPVLLSSTQASFQRKNTDATIVGAVPALNDVAKLAIVQGRFLSEFDHFETFAVIGHDVADALSTPQRYVQVGDAIRIENYMFTVIGIMNKAGQNPLMPVDFNNAIIVPMKRVQRLLPNAEISTVVIRLISGTDPIAASEKIHAYFESRVKGGSIFVQSARQLIEAMQKQNTLFTYLLAGIGSISLLVGGIGVMNVMLMGVLERRREIGLRMAIGARRKDICAMFLVESGTLSLIGGTLGTILGFAVAYLITSLSQWKFEWMTSALPLGVGMALIIGLVSGLYPAVMASRLHPIVALRSE